MTFPLSPSPMAGQQMPAQQGDMPSVGAAMEYRVKRVGARPLVFHGSELAMAMSFTPQIPYWYEVNIYRTDAQEFVLAVRLFFQSETEQDTVRAWTFGSLDAVMEAIENYDAGHDIRLNFEGFDEDMPPVEMAARALDLSARVEAARLHFAGLVGELFDEIDSATGAA